MGRLLITATLLLACGQAAPAAPPPSSTVVPTRVLASPPTPIAAPAPRIAPARLVPEGLVVHDTSSICEALGTAAREQDMSAGGLVPRSWLWIDDDGASCMSGPLTDDIDDFDDDEHEHCPQLSCDAAYTRCIDTESHLVFVLRPGTLGPYLHALVSYGEAAVPAVESGARAQALDHRDEICALLDAVRSSAPPIDPRGLTTGRPDTLHLSCGALATRAIESTDLRCESAVDLASGRPRENVSCEGTCWASRDECGVTQILARRDANGALVIFGAVWPSTEHQDDDPSTLFAPASTFLAAHTCGAAAGASATSRTRRALCELLQSGARGAISDDDGDGVPDEPPLPRGITIANGVLSVSAADTRQSYCTDALAAVDRDRVCDELRCDDAGARCVYGSDAYLLRQQPAGAELFGVIHYPAAPPPADEGRVATVIERRDRVCELFTMVRSGTLRIDPRGFARDAETGLERHCGADALAAAHAAIDELLAGERITCSQSDCRAEGRGEARILARRDAEQRLWIDGQAPFEADSDVGRFLDIDPCDP